VHVQSLMRPLVVVDASEGVEASLLLREVFPAGLVTSFFRVRGQDAHSYWGKCWKFWALPRAR
jgi:hypothetical protein